MQNILNFIHLAERLKIEKRRSKTSEGQTESVADHCWRLTLMILVYHKYLDKKISLEKALKIAIVHDLAEIITGDIPCCITDNSTEKKEQKKLHEKLAINKILSCLPDEVTTEIKQLYAEYEQEETYEAKFVKALDKIEAQIQYNESNFSFWTEYDIKNAPTRLNSYCAFDSFIKKLSMQVQKESLEKILSHTTTKSL
ncbi:MAG: HD domain-containing protein [Chlamydiota bacterium]